MTPDEIISAAQEKGIELTPDQVQRYAEAMTEWERPFSEPIPEWAVTPVIDFYELLGLHKEKWDVFLRDTYESERDRAEKKAANEASLVHFKAAREGRAS